MFLRFTDGHLLIIIKFRLIAIRFHFQASVNLLQSGFLCFLLEIHNYSNGRIVRIRNKLHHAPVAFNDTGNFDDPGVFGQVPWFYMDAVKYGTIIPHYSHNGSIPGGIPLRKMEMESWSHQYCFYEDDLRIGHV